MSKYLMVILISLLLYTTSWSESEILNSYIQQALHNNLALKQKEFVFQKSLAALKEARGMFLPSITFQTRYSRAEGGRQIFFPVGDIVNPIYQTLNQLLQSQQFPSNIPNVDVPFLREREHETRIRIVQPIFQPAIYYNQKIKFSLSEVQKSARNAFVRELIADIKIAYLNYLKTGEILKLLEQTKKMVEENLRVSQSLFENNKVTREAVYRATAELSEVEQKILEAEKNRDNVQSYFNFLLNRSLDSSIEITKYEYFAHESVLQFNEALQLALRNREELVQLKQGIKAKVNSKRIAQSAFLPTVTAVMDYGFEGEKYRFGKKATGMPSVGN